VCAICDAVDGYGIDDIPELLDLFANVDPRIFDQPGINGDYESCDAYLDCSVLRHPKVVSHLRYEASRVYQIETTAPRILTDLNQKSIALL
jgi:hypothetical protein